MTVFTSASATTMTFDAPVRQAMSSYTQNGNVASSSGSCYIVSTVDCARTCADNGASYAGIGFNDSQPISIKAVDGRAFTLGWCSAAEFPFSGRLDHTWAADQAPDGEKFACRLEVHDNNPSIEPDPAKLQTTLLFKLAD